MAKTMMRIPALSTIVAAIFFKSFKLDFHSMGRGIMKRYTSVVTFETNVTQRMGFEIAAWHTLPGFGLICQ
jgi:hypothetical protein